MEGNEARVAALGLPPAQTREGESERERELNNHNTKNLGLVIDGFVSFALRLIGLRLICCRVVFMSAWSRPPLHGLTPPPHTW